MMRLLVLTVAVLTATIVAHPHGGPGPHGHGHGRHGPGPHGPEMGPVRVIVDRLTDEQRRELFGILDQAPTDTKATLKQKREQFVGKLSAELQSAVSEEKKRFESDRAQDAEKVKSLSADAQTLYTNVFKLMNDDTITFDQERQQIDELIRKADRSVLEEFKKNRIMVPGMHGQHGGPPHGHGHGPELGPVHTIVPKLTEEQRRQLFDIVRSTKGETKAVIKQKIDEFVGKLSAKLQSEVEAEKKRFESEQTKQSDVIKTLSGEAQDLHTKVMELIANDSNTFPDERTKIDALIQQADQKILEELRSNNVHMPGLHGPPPSFGGRPHQGPFGKHGRDHHRV